MSPNLFLVAKRATTPWTWHQFHEKKTKLHFAKDPVPGIYATTHDGKRYLVAIKPSNQNAIDAVFRNDHHEKPRTRLAPKFSSSPDLTSSSISGVENDDLSITRMGSRSLPSINLSSTADNNANLQDSFSDDYEISDREAESFSSASTSSSKRSEEILPTIAIAYSGCESGCCSEDPYLSYAEPRFSHDGINPDEDKEALLFSRRPFSGGNHLTKQYVNYASPSSGRSLRLGESSASAELHNMQSQLTSSFNTAAYARFDIPTLLEPPRLTSADHHVHHEIKAKSKLIHLPQHHLQQSLTATLDHNFDEPSNNLKYPASTSFVLMPTHGAITDTQNNHNLKPRTYPSPQSSKTHLNSH